MAPGTRAKLTAMETQLTAQLDAIEEMQQYECIGDDHLYERLTSVRGRLTQARGWVRTALEA